MNTRKKFCVPLTVYYDASCPLCVTEMHALRELDWRGRLKLVDCSPPAFDDREATRDGMTREQLMDLIHVRDPEGRWLVGMDAFEAVYASAGLARVARVWGDRRWRPLLDRIYPWIARHRQFLSRLGVHRVVRLVLSRAARGQRLTRATPSDRHGSVQ